MPGKSIRKRYRLLPLICTGALVFIAFVLFALLIWAFAAYGGQRDPSQSKGVAAFIYLFAVFISCGVMTMLIRGGTVFPSAALGVLACLLTIIIAPAGAPFGRILLKLILTLIFAAAGFALAKLCCQTLPPPDRRPRQPVKRRDSLSTWEDGHRSLSEPGR